VIVLEILRAVQDSEGTRLVDELSTAVAAARAACGEVHILFDNRESAQFSAAARTKLTQAMHALRQPGDRIALLVTSSMMKVYVKNRIGEQTQAFLSENAARTWLRAWADRTAPSFLMAAK
jgi:hypothetical protein